MIGIYVQEEVLYPSFQLKGRNSTEVWGFLLLTHNTYHQKPENKDTFNLLKIF